MLSTLPLFYIAQLVNSDDRRARFQGLRVIMQWTPNILRTLSTIMERRGKAKHRRYALTIVSASPL